MVVFSYLNTLNFTVAEKTKICIGVTKSQRRIPGRKSHLRDVAATSADLCDLRSGFSFGREIRKEKYH